LLLWDCPSECDYTCQRQVTNKLREQNLPLHQFHGKWPFLRLGGIQEPCSVLFSILNFHGYYRGIRLVSQRIPDTFALKPYYILLGIFGMNAWVWSSIFHTRDFLFTERADYFSAGASVLYGLFYLPLRLFNLHQRDANQVRPYIKIWAGICIVAFLSHVYYLSFVTFSYSYNMGANIAVGIAQNIMWIYYSFTRSRSNRGLWVWTPLFVVVYVSLAMSLEVFDFFPIADALDAHALWHAATVPMVPPMIYLLMRLISSTTSSSKTQNMKFSIQEDTGRNYSHCKVGINLGIS
jgi:post-GPI attachment to proteins factor 3